MLWNKFRKMCNEIHGNLKEDAVGTASCVFPNGEITIFNTGNGVEAFIRKDNDNLSLVSKNLDIRDGFLGRKEFFGKEGILEVDAGPIRINTVHIKDKYDNVGGSLF